MFYALSWLLVALLLALWSATAWAMHAAAQWALSTAGAAAGQAGAGTSLTMPDTLVAWLPAALVDAVNGMLAAVAPAGEMLANLLTMAPALAGALGVTAWVVWAIGSLLLLALGGVAHLLIAFWRRRAPPPPPAAHAAAAH